MIKAILTIVVSYSIYGGFIALKTIETISQISDKHAELLAGL